MPLSRFFCDAQLAVGYGFAVRGEAIKVLMPLIGRRVNHQCDGRSRELLLRRARHDAVDCHAVVVSETVKLLFGDVSVRDKFLPDTHRLARIVDGRLYAATVAGWHFGELDDNATQGLPRFQRRFKMQSKLRDVDERPVGRVPLDDDADGCLALR